MIPDGVFESIPDEYMILESTDIKDLVNSVSEELSNGWVCQGGIAAIHMHDDENDISGTITFFQAMVRNYK